MGLEIALSSPTWLRDGDLVVREADIRGRRTRLALAHLVLERHHRIPISALADVLWPHALPPAWPSSVREVVSRVRRLFSAVGHPHAVATRDRCLHVTLPDEVWVDVEQALRAARHPRESTDQTRQDARNVVAVAGSPFLPGEDGPWVRGWQERLQAALVEALGALARDALASGDTGAAAELAQRMIDEEPTTETGHELLIRSLARSGRRAEALRSYDRYRRALADQLGVDPPVAMQALHLDLLNDVAPPSEARPSHDLVVAEVPDLPPALLYSVDVQVPFVGRASEVNAILDGLAAVQDVRVVLVGGEPAAGKTRLLAEVARRGFLPPGPVLYARCDAAATGPCAAAIYAALHGGGVHPDGDPPQLCEAVGRLSRLSNGQTVSLLLDDVHWIDDPTARFVVKLISQQPFGSFAVVMTYASTEPSRRLNALIAELHRLTRPRYVEVRPLGADAVRAMARRVLGRRPCGDVATAELLAESGGNAGYLAELLLAQADGSAPAVPAAIRARVLSVMDALAPDALALLRAAAVADAPFAMDAVARTAGLEASDEWLHAADDLVLRGLLVAATHPGQLRFRHGVVRRVALAAMGPLLREHLAARQRASDAAAARPTLHQHPANSRPAAVS